MIMAILMYSFLMFDFSDAMLLEDIGTYFINKLNGTVGGDDKPCLCVSLDGLEVLWI